MSTLSTSLNTIGINQAKGVELVMQRDQLRGTLPNERRTAEQPQQRSNPRQLSPAEERQVRELQQIDRAVREHEAAHLRAGRGVVTGGANFTYTYGPDGRQYAIGGEVGIDTSKEAKPEQNIDKGNRIQEAALAPRDPSPQDYRVASIGGRLESQGRSDLAAQQREEQAARIEEDQRQAEQPAPDTESTESSGNEPAARDAGGDARVAQAYALAGPAQGAGLSVYA